MRLVCKTKFFCQHASALSRRNPRITGRSSNDHRNCSAGNGRLDFFREAPGFAGILCNKITAVILSQHCPVHFLGKGSLHGNEIFPLKAQLPAGFYNRRKGQHSCKNPFLVVRNFCKCFQFLTSCGKKNFPLCFFQIPDSSLCAFYINRLLMLTVVSQHPYAGNFCIAAGCTDILRHLRRIGMSGIQYKLRPFLF